MNPRILYIPPASRPSMARRVASLAGKALAAGALWAFLWAFGIGLPVIVSAALGRL